MYQVILLNENGTKFEKQFESEYLYNKFLNKAKRSKKLTIISYGKEY
jgi:hypothetical protein